MTDREKNAIRYLIDCDLTGWEESFLAGVRVASLLTERQSILLLNLESRYKAKSETTKAPPTERGENEGMITHGERITTPTPCEDCREPIQLADMREHYRTAHPEIVLRHVN